MELQKRISEWKAILGSPWKWLVLAPSALLGIYQEVQQQFIPSWPVAIPVSPGLWFFVTLILFCWLILEGAYRRIRTLRKDGYSRDNELVNTKSELVGVKEERDNLIKQSAQTQARHTYIPDAYIHGRIIYLLDLIAPGARPLIQKRTIEDCEIRGPAMIGFLDGCTLHDLSFDVDKDAIFVEVTLGRQLSGVIGFENCTIRNCRLVAIGIIGTKPQIAQMEKAWGNPMPPTLDKEGSQK